jgi:hypothetical protein
VDRDHFREVRQARDDELSFVEAVKEVLQQDYTLHPEVTQNRYQLKVTKEMMARQVPNAMTDVIDEIQAAFDDEMDLTEGKLSRSFELTLDWTPCIPLLKAQKIIARTSNRMFVGLPLCIVPLRYCSHLRSQ